jgi:hypothetical protein
MSTAKQRHSDYVSAQARKQRALRHEVPTIPPSSDPELRGRVTASLESFLVEIFPDPPLFSRPFGPVQRSSIAHEEDILRGRAGMLNKLEPRC